MSTAEIETNRYGLLYFIALSGLDGLRWVEEYRRFELLEHWKDQALATLRGGDAEGGRQILMRLQEALSSHTQMPSSIRRVQERWYYGALAYYHYCVEELDLAEDGLNLASVAVRDAVEECPFLAPLAHHCSDFSIQKARIARQRRCWAEMRHWIDESRMMLQGLSPYCVLSDGAAVTVATIKAFYRSLPLDPEAEEHLTYFLDDATRLGHFERSVFKLYTPVAWVIPYP